MTHKDFISEDVNLFIRTIIQVLEHHKEHYSHVRAYANHLDIYCRRGWLTIEQRPNGIVHICDTARTHQHDIPTSHPKLIAFILEITHIIHMKGIVYTCGIDWAANKQDILK